MTQKLLVLLSFFSLSIALFAVDVTMGYYGYDGTTTVDGSVNYYAQGGADGTSGWAGTEMIGGNTFVPQDITKQLKITFSTVQLAGTGYLYIFDRALTDADCTSMTEPTGYAVKLQTGDQNVSFVSTNHAIGVVYLQEQNDYGHGWSAVVEECSVTPMTLDNIETVAVASETFIGERQCQMMRLKVSTSGLASPLVLNALKCDLSGCSSLQDIESLAVYTTHGGDRFAGGQLLAKKTTILSSMSFDLTQKLSVGDTYLWVVAAISKKAEGTHTLDLSVPQLTIANQVKVVASPNPIGTILIQNEYRIARESLSYQVGRSPIAFYDAQGKTSKIEEGFEGQITFLPANPGDKVAIDFTKIQLFDTNLALNDQLTVYMGDAVASASYHITLLKQTDARIIESTAANGALTVTFKSSTGANFGDGWEALVFAKPSETMQVEQFASQSASSDAIASASQDAEVLEMNLKTKGNAQAMRLESLQLHADCFSALKSVKVYATGAMNHYRDAEKKRVEEAVFMGSVTPTSADFTLPMTTSDLRNGDNFFFVVYDLKDYVADNTSLDAKAVSATFENNRVEAIVSPASEAYRYVENLYVSQVGTHTVKVTNSWQFTHKPSAYIPGYYACEMGDQIVTFVPQTPDRVIEMEMADFELFYAFKAGIKTDASAQFEVYSGTQIDASHLLWQVNTKEDFTKGPQRVLRSNTDDGCLTVRFNTVHTLSTRTGRGWHATVREYLPKDMEFASLEALPVTQESVVANATNEVVMGVKVVTEGNLTVLSMSQLVVDTKQSSGSVMKASLYYTTLCDTLEMTQAVKVAETLNLGAQTTFDFAPLLLKEGPNYFWVCYDTPSSVVSDQVLDAQLVSATIQGEVKVPTGESDPIGERLTKKLVYLQSGDNGEMVIDGSFLFYDKEGPTQPMPNAFNGKITFMPSTPGNAIKIEILKLGLGFRDSLNVYYKRRISKSDKPNESVFMNDEAYCPIQYISSAVDGSMTIDYRGFNVYVPADGWEIIVSEVRPSTLNVGLIEVESIAPASLMKGATQVGMMHMIVNVSGDKGSVSLDEFHFKTPNMSSSDFTQAEIYYTDTSSVFGLGDLYGSCTNQPVKISGKQVIRKAGKYHFWLTYDIGNSCQVGALFEAHLSSVKINNVSTSVFSSITAQSTVKSGMHGHYTIGASGSGERHFTTFAQAVAALKQGVDGKVEFTVEAGNYPEQLKLPAINGTSLQNTVTFKATPGSVTLAKNTYNKPAYGEEKFGMFSFVGADYIVLDGLNFTTTEQWPSLVNLKHASQHITIKNCHFIYPMVDSSLQKMTLIDAIADNTAYQNNDYITIENCQFEGGYFQVCITGAGAVYLPAQKGAIIRNNQFRDFGATGIILTREHGFEINHNSLEAYSSNKTSVRAIKVTCESGSVIKNNTIEMQVAKTAYGLYLNKSRDDIFGAGGRGSTAGSLVSENTMVYNNSILIKDAAFSCHGIGLEDALTHTVIAYNSVVLEGQNPSSSAALFVSASSKDQADAVVIQNNILQNKSQGYAVRINHADGLGVSKTRFSHNVYFTNGANLAYAGTVIPDFAQWTPLTGDSGSQLQETHFVSPKSLDLLDRTDLIEAEAMSLITVDINGRSRSVLPTPGAYQFNTDSDVVPEFMKTYPKMGQVTNQDAEIVIKTNQDAHVYMLAQLSSDAVPTKTMVMAQKMQLVYQNAESIYKIEGLNTSQDYKVYVVLESLRGLSTDVVESIAFKSGINPTQVATFEQATMNANQSIDDGTAHFQGCLLVNQGFESAKSILVENGAKISITNSTDGIVLNGFMCIVETPVTMVAYNGLTQVGQRILTVNEDWHYESLREFGPITHCVFTMNSADGEMQMDNFCGEPAPLKIEAREFTVPFFELTPISLDCQGGVWPYTYTWYNFAGVAVGYEKELNVKLSSSLNYSLKVVDAWKNEATVEVHIDVKGRLSVGDFEDFYLKPESHYVAEGTGSEEIPTHFHTGSFDCVNYRVPAWNSWSGMAYSNETSTEYTGNLIEEQYRSSAGHGVKDSEKYGICYIGKPRTNAYPIYVKNEEDGDTIRGFYINAPASVVSAVKNGDGTPTGTAFAQGDSLIVVVNGYKAFNKVSSVRYALADYRSTEAADHYVVDSWQWLDLFALGTVDAVEFIMEGSKNNAYGLTTPAYFCMDNIGDERPEILVANQKFAFKGSIDLATLCSIEGDGNTEYSLVESGDSRRVRVELKGSVLNITAVTQQETSVVVRVMNQGKQLYYRIPINKEGVDVEQVQVDSRFDITVDVDSRSLLVETSVENYALRVVNTAGQVMAHYSALSGSTVISDLSSMPQGVYLVQCIYSNAIQTVKVVL